jgi:hypothetical protein
LSVSKKSKWKIGWKGEFRSTAQRHSNQKACKPIAKRFTRFFVSGEWKVHSPLKKIALRKEIFGNAHLRKLGIPTVINPVSPTRFPVTVFLSFPFFI